MAYETTTQSVTGYFTKRSNAESAVDDLMEAGFTQSQISLALRPDYDGADTTSSTSTAYAAGQKTGSVWNKIAGFFGERPEDDIAGKTTYPLESTAAPTGPVRSGYDYEDSDFHGSIKELNVPEEHAKYFTHRFGSGEEGALVTVSAAGREAEAEAILEKHSADIGRNAADFDYTTDARRTQPEAQRVQLFGEVLKVHKERLARGEVTIRKNVITENKTFEVPVTREEFVITRHAVTGDTPAPAGSIGEASEIRIPLSEEQVYFDKQNVVTEEVSVGKRAITENQTLSGSVRHEELQVDKSSAEEQTTPRKPLN